MNIPHYSHNIAMIRLLFAGASPESELRNAIFLSLELYFLTFGYFIYVYIYI